jgi:hypothetical protein
MAKTLGPINCACVIHGTAYDWTYVDRLYNMLCRHITAGVVLHVYTEADRPVPAPYVKHSLIEWDIQVPRKAWWYKMQLFDPDHYRGPLLYFDLDIVIVNNIDWIWKQNPVNFWAVRDFKYLWKPSFTGINSSVMWWNTENFAYVWQNFKQLDLAKVMREYHGDQDFLTEFITHDRRRFLDPDRVRSWRWQCVDGGYDFRLKTSKKPGIGTCLTPLDSVLVFHGKPKPCQIQDSVIQQNWR